MFLYWGSSEPFSRCWAPTWCITASVPSRVAAQQHVVTGFIRQQKSTKGPIHTRWDFPCNRPPVPAISLLYGPYLHGPPEVSWMPTSLPRIPPQPYRICISATPVITTLHYLGVLTLLHGDPTRRFEPMRLGSSSQSQKGCPGCRARVCRE